MALAISNRGPCVSQPIWTVHCLKQIVFKAARAQVIGHQCGLGVDELELVSFALNPGSASFWADANPVDAFGDLKRTIGLDGDFKALGMQGGDQGVIDLQERFTAR